VCSAGTVTDPDRLETEILEIIQAAPLSHLGVETSAAKLPVAAVHSAIVDDVMAGRELATPLTRAACRTLVVDSEKRPQRGQFLPDLPPHSPAMGQKAGEKWAAAVVSQPTIPKSDRLLDLSHVGHPVCPRRDVAFDQYNSPCSTPPT